MTVGSYHGDTNVVTVGVVGWVPISMVTDVYIIVSITTANGIKPSETGL